jgi:predicted transglutaminase-like cysteine proteinase
MIKFIVAAAILTQGLFAASVFGAEQASVSPRSAAPSAFMRVYGASPPPFGFVSFCERVPAECAGQQAAYEPRFEATPQRLSELDEVNRLVNNAIQPATDLEIYGLVEYWTLPIDRGDCEDYALLKRHILIQRGWPASALLMTVVRDERGDGHAILTVRTGQGDFVLDNKVANIRMWHQTGYRYVMRQSFVDPRLWMSLVPEGTDRAGALTSTPARR